MVARQGDLVGGSQPEECAILIFPTTRSTTDVIGKPVLMLNAAGRIAGTGEYDPFGHVNRVFIDAETSHPYGTTNGVFATFTQPVGSGFAIGFRLLGDLLDLQEQSADPALCVMQPGQPPPPFSDVLEMRDQSGSVRWFTWGRHSHFVFDWTPTPFPGGSFQLAIRNVGTCFFSRDPAGNCVTSCDGVPSPRSKSGVVAGSYEYRRYEVGQTPFWTPLRLPGQYYDPESDLFENWNRFYDPSIGRYLQPEPMMQKPQVVQTTLGLGRSMSAYSYAFNNPLFFTDEDGLYGTKCCNYYEKRCSQAGGSYYCSLAQSVCGNTQTDDPNPNWRDCVRKCLQDYDNNSCPNPKDKNPNLTGQHLYCFRKCLSPKKNPFNGQPQGDDPQGCL